MPWLIMDEVLFFHVPRCGGTSITKHHRVGYKSRKGKNPYYKFGLMYYYYRYRLYEHSNFPLFTWENLIAMTQITIAVFLYFFVTPVPPAPYIMWTTATITFTLSTFIWTAPITMRNNFLRRFLMFFQAKVLCGFGSDTKYMVGTNMVGYLFHITAPRAINHGYVSLEQVNRCAFSIVRNPYSRMVSMFEYNKRPLESFENFCRKFHADYWNIYIGKHTCECKEIYCHILPMFEYTHMNGEQIVSCVIKQEHLKTLVASNWEDSGVPKNVQDALTGIPHANKRTRKVAWQKYFTQETMNLVYNMYRKDFEIFGYDTAIPGRPDLVLSTDAVNESTSLRYEELGRSMPAMIRRRSFEKVPSAAKNSHGDFMDDTNGVELAITSEPSSTTSNAAAKSPLERPKAHSIPGTSEQSSGEHTMVSITEIDEEEARRRREAAVFILDTVPE